MAGPGQLVEPGREGGREGGRGKQGVRDARRRENKEGRMEIVRPKEESDVEVTRKACECESVQYEESQVIQRPPIPIQCTRMYVHDIHNACAMAQ